MANDGRQNEFIKESFDRNSGDYMDYMDYVDYVEGGVETLKHKYPWLVYFKRISKAEVLKPGRTIPGKINLACTGALLDQRHVLIAAHCINEEDFQQFTYQVQGSHHYDYTTHHAW